jgi:hypothetical protein
VDDAFEIDRPDAPSASPVCDAEPERSRVNRLWSYYNEHKALTFEPRPLIAPGTRVFTMGSCFAVEIRRRLKELGYTVYPDYGSLAFDPARQKVGSLPARENLNHYHSFAIRQEIEKAFGLWRQDDDDYWRIGNSPIDEPLFDGPVCQDPYRRLVFGRTPADLHEVTAGLDAVIRAGLEAADVYILTLGLIEVWRNKRSGLISCMNPGYGGGGGVEETEFANSGFAENYDNMRRAIELLFEHYPERRVILTVSPVPLGATFTDADVFVANMESKSTLRAVAGQLAAEFDRVDYFPSYEICQMGNPFSPDGRHVRPEVVAMIVATFLRMFGTVEAA